jgi:hypothetical protein
MTKQIKKRHLCQLAYDEWNYYLQIFVKFVKSIDFQTCNDTLL